MMEQLRPAASHETEPEPIIVEIDGIGELEFPADTDQAVIQAKVRELTSSNQSGTDRIKADMRAHGMSDRTTDWLIDGLSGGGVMTAAAGPKVIQGLAKRIYSGLLKPKQALKDSFGGAQNIAEGLLAERAPIGAGGLQKVTQRLGQSRDAAMGMVRGAEQAGTPGVGARDVISEFADVVGELRKRADIGQAVPMQQVGQRGQALVKTAARTGGEIPLTRAQQLKETAQDAASGAYRAMERGGQKQLGADDLLDAAVAKGMRKGIEQRVPAVGAQNARTQSLLGGRRALEDAIEREANNVGIGGMRDIGALVAGLGGTAAGGPALGATGAAIMRGMATPAIGSRVAIGMNEAGRLGGDDALARALMVLLSQGSHQE